MMRVRLLSEPEYRQMLREGTCREYRESNFYTLMREKGDFTDEASCRLLRTLHGDAAVEGKWYSRTTPEGKPCLPALSPEAQYGLVVVENSRNGIYTPIDNRFCVFETQRRMEGRASSHCGIPLVWDAFAAMDMDILLVFRKKDFNFSWDIQLGNDFILENYHYGGAVVEAVVEETRIREEMGADGVLRVDNFFYDEKYVWYQEPKELLEVLSDLNLGMLPLVRGELTLGELYRLCDDNDDVEREDWKAGTGEAPWLKGRVLNHMDYRPEEPESRRIVYMVVEKHPDGSYLLRNRTSGKYPEYIEMLDQVMELAVPGGEILTLAVDVNEIMQCAADVNKAVCAFRVADEAVETFGRQEGLLVFEEALREALASGKCGVRTEDDD